jgi:HlyD family secretion protein
MLIRTARTREHIHMDTPDGNTDVRPPTTPRWRTFLRVTPTKVLIGAVALAAILVSTRPDRPEISIPEKAWSVQMRKITLGAVSPSLQLYGRVQSPLDAGLRAAVEGDVIEVLVRDGDHVAADQVLARLDRRDAELELMQRGAEVQDIEAQIRIERKRLSRNREALEKERELLRLTQSNADRAASLYKDKLLSASDVDNTSEALKKQQLSVTSRQLNIEENELRIGQLQAQLARATAIRDKAQLAIDRTEIRAPFAGVISNIGVSIGDRVRPGDEAMRVYDPDSIEIRAQIPTRYAPLVRETLASGATMPATVTVDGLSLDAALERLAGQTRTGSGSVDAFLTLEPVPGVARLGASSKVYLSLPAADDVVELPAEAMYGRDRIYKVVDNRIRAIRVERVGERAGADGRTGVIVRSPDLADGDVGR